MAKEKPENNKTAKTEPLEKQLWKAADKLRKNIDAAEYKHIVLGLIFLKYISDSFEQHFAKLSEGKGEYVGADPEDKDEYSAENVFFVPQDARWSYLQSHAKQPDIGKLVDAAMDAIEKENASLKGVLPKVFARDNLDPASLGQLIDLVGNIALGDAKSRSADVLGHVFEYFLGEFALAEGKQGGQFYTPRSVVELLVEMLEPYNGRVFDPCCGSGGMFVQSEKFVADHQGRVNDISIYGQESNQTTWRLAKMNLAIRGIEASQVKWNNEGSFLNDAHKDVKADYIIANPPFNVSDWSGELLRTDGRWQYGVPPAGNANFAWLQHFIYHLSPQGQAGVVLAKGALTSKTSGEGEIRKALIEQGNVIDCIVNLPAKLFLNTQIPAALWFMRRNRKPSPSGRGQGEGGFADRSNEILFIDARNLGHLINRRTKELSHEDIKQITDTYHNWRNPTEPSPLGRGQGEGGGEGNKLAERLLENARELRKNQTDAEALLWSLLRGRQLNDCKFRRQHPVEPYILDFYCHENNLAIELDGGQHNTESAIANDHKRTEYLKSQGITVLRFWNNDVLQNTESVLQQIYSTLTPALSQKEREYKDIPGFCASVSIDRVKELDYVLTPGRYVGLPDDEDDFNFAERFNALKAEFEAQLEEEEKLNKAIAENLARVKL
ncbi:MAG: N-6 DNA methylase [Methylotenera sp.]|nr:N-6 DNA methylase [Methylotenera sp.]